MKKVSELAKAADAIAAVKKAVDVMEENKKGLDPEDANQLMEMAAAGDKTGFLKVVGIGVRTVRASSGAGKIPRPDFPPKET